MCDYLRGSRCIDLLIINIGARWGVVGHRHASAALPPGKSPGAHCAGGWVGPSAGLHGCGEQKISCPPTGVRTPNRPARSESRY